MVGESVFVTTVVEGLRNSNKTRILDIIVLVPTNNPQGLNKNVTLFIYFSFGGVVTIVDCIANTKLYVSNI